MEFDESILREADIRGVYSDQINAEFAKRLGKVFGTYMQSLNQDYCVVGHDNRFGGPQLTKNLIEGLLSTGTNVIYVGLCTTPMLNYASRRLKQEYGIMVTASHNPKDNNGFKLFGKRYQHCDHKVLDKLYAMLKDKDLKFALGEGVIEAVNIEDAYAKALADSFDFNNDKTKMKVVVDCGNGTGSIIIRKVYERLPFDVVYINSDSNPNFPNHHPDPNVKANLRGLAEAVRRNKAQLGIAYDGDVDRAGFVDDKGNIVDADVITAILSKEIIKEAKNKTILIDVKCSKVCIDEIEANGGTVLMDTPSSACEERIIDEQDIPFCGSYSNHFFFRDRHPGYDDGIYTGLRVQEMLLKRKKNLSTIVNKLSLYYNTEEIKVNVGDDKKWDVVEGFKKYCDDKKYKYDAVDGVRVYINDGWALVRASNTGPNLTLRFESETKSGLNKIQKEVLNELDSLK